MCVCVRVRVCVHVHACVHAHLGWTRSSWNAKLSWPTWRTGTYWERLHSSTGYWLIFNTLTALYYRRHGWQERRYAFILSPYHSKIHGQLTVRDPTTSSFPQISWNPVVFYWWRNIHQRVKNCTLPSLLSPIASVIKPILQCIVETILLLMNVNVTDGGVEAHPAPLLCFVSTSAKKSRLIHVSATLF